MAAATFLLTWLVRLALYLAGLLGLVMSVLVFVSVLMRYVFLSPLRFTDELVGLLFAACVFLAIPFVFAMDLNIRVTLVTDLFSAAVRRIVDPIAHLASIVFFLIFGYLSFDFASVSFLIGARSDMAQIPVAPWMGLMPVSCFLTVLILLMKASFAHKGLVFGTPAERRLDGTAG